MLREVHHAHDHISCFSVASVLLKGCKIRPRGLV